MEHEKLAAIAAIIDEADEMRNAYFFPPVGNAHCRRSFEKRHSHDEVAWEEGGHSYTAAYTVRCTCGHVYASGEYTRDGKKTTLTAIRNSYKRMISCAVREGLAPAVRARNQNGGDANA